jgi:DNA-binding Lrp family transcriptional regulator
MTGAHQETIRYKMKQQFVSKGFRFQADVDYRKLGLSLHWGKIVVSPAHYGSATRFFRSLNDAAYLIHFSKILPQGYFIALFALPEGTTTEFAQFLERLKRHKIISEFTLDRVSAQRHKSSDPHFFNFRRDQWKVDWDKVKTLKASPLTADVRRTEVSADRIDLLLTKELQKDARQHVVGIGRKLKLKPKTLEYHYRAHIVGGGLIPSYRVRWMKDTDQPLSRTTATIRAIFRGLDGDQYKLVQAAMNRLPYLWVEDLLESGTYIVGLAVPLEDLAPTMAYINRELPFLGDHVDIGYLSIEDSYNYTIPYQMFSEGKWQFDVKKMESAVLKELNTGVTK